MAQRLGQSATLTTKLHATKLGAVQYILSSMNSAQWSYSTAAVYVSTNIASVQTRAADFND